MKPNKRQPERYDGKFPTLAWLHERSRDLWHQYRASRKSSGDKKLRMCETLSLGDRRFVAVIELDGERFLVGGGPNSVSLLTTLSRTLNRKPAKTRRAAATA